MLKVENLSKSYQTDTVLTTVFDNLSFEVQTGEFVAITGPSGAGKTTLLNTLGLLEDFQQGNLIINGKNVASMKDRELSTLRNNHIGFVFQNFNLLPELSVLDNVMLPLEIAGLPKSKAKLEAKRQLEIMGLQGRTSHKPNQLSGGQQQRVAIARALVNAPTLILADEPTGNLNSTMAKEIMLLLKKINESGTTIIMVTHDDLLAKMASRTIELIDGKIFNASQEGLVECA